VWRSDQRCSTAETDQLVTFLQVCSAVTCAPMQSSTVRACMTPAEKQLCLQVEPQPYVCTEQLLLRWAACAIMVMAKGAHLIAARHPCPTGGTCTDRTSRRCCSTLRSFPGHGRIEHCTGYRQHLLLWAYQLTLATNHQRGSGESVPHSAFGSKLSGTGSGDCGLMQVLRDCAAASGGVRHCSMEVGLSSGRRPP
jgi:hypothetical protein